MKVEVATQHLCRACDTACTHGYRRHPPNVPGLLPPKTTGSMVVGFRPWKAVELPGQAQPLAQHFL